MFPDRPGVAHLFLISRGSRLSFAKAELSVRARNTVRAILKGMTALGVVCVLLWSLMVVDASEVDKRANASFRGNGAVTDYAGVSVISKGIVKISSTSTASGDTVPGVEVSNSLPSQHRSYQGPLRL